MSRMKHYEDDPVYPHIPIIRSRTKHMIELLWNRFSNTIPLILDVFSYGDGSEVASLGVYMLVVTASIAPRHVR